MSQILAECTVAQLRTMLAKNEISSVELTEAYLAMIGKKNVQIGAYITVTAEKARNSAIESDARRDNGLAPSALDGIPVAYQDDICTKGVFTTCASRMLETFAPPYDATVVDRLKNSVMLGKLNMLEFGVGKPAISQAMRHPFDETRSIGGFSGGAAVAAGLAPFALGSDAGGNVRLSAISCGMVGMKPTYGTVSRYGLIASGSSLEQIGPVTRTVEDCALVLSEIVGRDARDAMSVSHGDIDFIEALQDGVKGMRFVLPKELFEGGITPEAKEAIVSAAKTLEAHGAIIEEASFPMLREAQNAHTILATAEMSSNLSCMSGINFGRRAENCADVDEIYARSRAEGFGEEVQKRVLLGNLYLCESQYDAYYKKAMQVRTLIRRDFDMILEGRQGILMPVAPQDGQNEQYTLIANLTGAPALAMPWGVSAAAIGVQIIGKMLGERDIIRAAYALEREGRGA